MVRPGCLSSLSPCNSSVSLKLSPSKVSSLKKKRLVRWEEHSLPSELRVKPSGQPSALEAHGTSSAWCGSGLSAGSKLGWGAWPAPGQTPRGVQPVCEPRRTGSGHTHHAPWPPAQLCGMLTTCQGRSGRRGKDLNQQAAPPQAQTQPCELPAAASGRWPLLAEQHARALSSPGRKVGVAEGRPDAAGLKPQGLLPQLRRNSFSSAPLTPHSQRTSCPDRTESLGCPSQKAPKVPPALSPLARGPSLPASPAVTPDAPSQRGTQGRGVLSAQIRALGWRSRAADPPGEPRLAPSRGPEGSGGLYGERPGLGTVLPRATGASSSICGPL